MHRQASRLALLALLLVTPFDRPPAQERTTPPNVVFVLADDLGYGELGCYGQQKIRTPHIDRLAAQGMRFTQAYAGAPVCAPSRCVLLSGRHLANAQIRGNKPVRPEGQWPITADLELIPEVLASAGYVSGAFGKWGLGPANSDGSPMRHGFETFVGYICQREAHSYYPRWLWHNDEKLWLDNGIVPGHAKWPAPPEDDAAYDEFYGNVYAPDVMLSAARGWLRGRAREEGVPFFLYLPFVEPHVAMQPPEEWVEQYPESWDGAPYHGQRGYVPHPRPRAGYAAMISDLDQHVGSIVDLLDELGLAEDTLVLFSSDNGPTHDVGGVDTGFFDSAGGLRGRKGSVYEGGLRVPMIARWPGVVAAGSTTDHVCAFQDVMPTLAELAGVPPAEPCDGISFLPTLRGEPDVQQQHDHLVWEFFGYGGLKAVRMGRYKAVQREIRRPDGPAAIEVYDLREDPAESTDLADQRPDLVEKAARIFREDRTPEPDFPMPHYDRAG